MKKKESLFMKRFLAILTALFMLAALPCFAEDTEAPGYAVSLSNLVLTMGGNTLDLSALNLTVGGTMLDEGTIASLVDLAANDESALTIYLLTSMADEVLVATAASGEVVLPNAISIDISEMSSAANVDVDVDALIQQITALGQQISGILAGVEASEPEAAAYTFHGSEEAVAGTVTVTSLSEEQISGILSALAEVIPNIDAENLPTISAQVSVFASEAGDANAAVVELTSGESTAAITVELTMSEAGYALYGEAAADGNVAGYLIGSLTMPEGIISVNLQAFDAGDNELAEINCTVANDEDGYAVSADFSAQGNMFSTSFLFNPAEMSGHVGLGYYTASSEAESSDLVCVLSVDADVALCAIDAQAIPAAFEGKDIVTIEDIQDTESEAYQNLMGVVGTALQKLAAVPAIGALLGAGQE